MIQSGLYYEISEKKGKQKIKLKSKIYFIQLAIWVLVFLIVI
jgi:hypothetical protein